MRNFTHESPALNELASNRFATFGVNFSLYFISIDSALRTRSQLLFFSFGKRTAHDITEHVRR